MRSIPESLKAKMRLLNQTKANNADPRLDAVISRHVIPIQEYKMWQTSRVANFSGRVSIAVPRPDHRKMPEKIFAGGIDNGTVKIYSAKFDGINAPELWNKVMEIPDAVDFCMSYEGLYKPWKKGVEFYTPAPYPWVFWIDSNQDLWAQVWGDAASKVLIGTNVTSCSATMGVDSVQRDWGQGLIVAWTTVAGSVFYAQLTDVTWSEGVEVTWAPPDAVEIVVSRVADVRLVFMVKDTAGTVTAMYFRSIAISTSNYEQLEISKLKATASTTPVVYRTFDMEHERVEVGLLTSAELVSILAPEIAIVSNLGDEDGNFGRFVIVEFKHEVYDFDGQHPQFKFVDSENTNLLCLSVDGFAPNKLLLELQDFNNAVSPCYITYVPGTLRGGVTPAPYLVSPPFAPVGLIPIAVDPPVAVNVMNIEEVDPNS